MAVHELEPAPSVTPARPPTSPSFDDVLEAPSERVTPAPSERRRRRQWGAERPRPPLPAAEKPAAPGATWLGGLAITGTVVGWGVYLGSTVVAEFIDHGVHDAAFIAQTVAYVVVMTLLLFSSAMYLVARQGALYRSREHARVPRAEIDAFVADVAPSLTVLVPSYAEEPAVVRATLLSAALQEYPGMRVVLLLDDPPEPTDRRRPRRSPAAGRSPRR